MSTETMFSVGDSAYLARDVIEHATEDHPAFLMGKSGERVQILEYRLGYDFPYLVEGPTNPGKPWGARAADLMRTKPLRCNG